LRYLIASSLLLFSLAGCGAVDDNLPRTVNASGVVYCDGEPLEGAVIVIMQDSGQYFARGATDSRGRFSLDAYESKKGAVPGTYKMTVSKTVEVDKATPVKVSAALQDDAQHAAEGDPGRANVSWVNDLPSKYSSPVTSGLQVTIPDDGTKDLKIELSRS
jgi:hypothetical protein